MLSNSIATMKENTACMGHPRFGDVKSVTLCHLTAMKLVMVVTEIREANTARRMKKQRKQNIITVGLSVRAKYHQKGIERVNVQGLCRCFRQHLEAVSNPELSVPPFVINLSIWADLIAAQPLRL